MMDSGKYLVSFLCLACAIAPLNATSLGSTCSVDTDCSVTLPKVDNSICLTGLCSCAATHVPNSGTCSPKVVIDETCEISAQCPVGNSNCAGTAPDRKCVCTAGYVASTDKTKCLKLQQGVDDDCEESSQCTATPNLECPDKTVCKCKENFVQYQSTCEPRVLTINSGLCKNSIQCPENSRCLANSPTTKTCQCNSDFIPFPNTSPNSCLKRAAFGENCSASVQCTTSGNVECASGKCSCKADNYFAAAENTCSPTKKLGEACTNTVQCVLSENIDRVHCLDILCQCKPTFIPDLTRNRCTSDAARNTITAAFAVVLLTLGKLM
ncbi:stabilin-2-like [Neocloeon triangulifer]|uniref:stabilin-2-like n=1 Tax=Neocloeon triangulifer TaxID=2078957 RepID=UPI00286F2105|nr:stabilin-2-like [Neocloeon triangulifer]